MDGSSGSDGSHGCGSGGGERVTNHCGGGRLRHLHLHLDRRELIEEVVPSVNVLDHYSSVRACNYMPPLDAAILRWPSSSFTYRAREDGGGDGDDDDDDAQECN